jgi:outer membrane protein
MLNAISERRASCLSIYFLLAVSLLISSETHAQQPATDSLLSDANLPNIIQYALKRQPQVQQSLIDEETTALQIKSKLADWYPQLNFNYLYQHNFQVQTSIIGGNPVRLGVGNTSALQFSASQAIFNRDVLLAKRTKGEVQQLAKQLTGGTKIDVVVTVSKAFYDLLATQQQLKVVNENITRLERSLKDARARFDAGIADKTDYKRATIALNNARVTKKSSEEAILAKTAYLKTVINYPDKGSLVILYDSASLEREILLDTLDGPDFSQRIEYNILQTQRKLQEANLSYNKWSYLPSVSANGGYNMNFLNNSFGKLYNQSFPNSFAGLTLSVPIFQGGKRKYNIELAQWQIKRTDLDIISFRNAANAEYTAALSAYKAGLANYLAIKENVILAQEVYDVINLQYRAGIKTYLEVITAETDLRTAQLNYFNALYQVLSNKIDVQKSKGDIIY